MSWNTGFSAAAAVLLAYALGGFRGLFVAIALFVFWWALRSIRIVGAAHAQTHSDERQPDEMNAAERERARAQAQEEAECPWEEAQQREAARNAEQERQAWQRSRQTERERATEQWDESQSERDGYEENDWWNVLEVPPYASKDEIRHAYYRKIKQCHPDRVAGLAPELLAAAERCSRMLNAAYTEANRAQRKEIAAQ